MPQSHDQPEDRWPKTDERLHVRPGKASVLDVLFVGQTGPRRARILATAEALRVLVVLNVAPVHAFSTRCHPGRGIFVARYEGRANGLTPCYSAEERRTLSGATVAFDCTWPPSWDRTTTVPVKATFEGIYSDAIRSRVVRRWHEFGLG